ncbi:M6 family metalloprotease domain-containing protein [Actinomadura rugatobispora]|uniref:M6 family metalloprotease domain-containing protein n=1 Tax=Actinomadura rugatobispora TaxID=1994 RepID=A0ABW1A5H3_9ACTN|nr:hypothetical protein GCM10010200_018350 [Actinomadura rugatobispora]
MSEHLKECGHARAVWPDLCAVAPSPDLRERLNRELEEIRERGPGSVNLLGMSHAPRMRGFDDATLFPADEYARGTPESTIRSAAADRAPLRGQVRVIVIPADFSDRAMTTTNERLEELFFSLGAMEQGSVREYYREVTHGLVDIVGQVVEPVRLPRTLAWYANNNFGIGRPSGEARANIMARDAVVKADPTVDFTPYDNDGNGYVDACIVVHAGPSGDATGNPGDIWAHKWTLPEVYNADNTKVFAYLTVAEDAKIGVCAHELGHLLFGFPDLYDVDGTSEGVGNWCLMGAGSWGGGGARPVHPSAWCKIRQGWVRETNVTANGTLRIPDVKTGFEVHRLWRGGEQGDEYFLVENRQRDDYDGALPTGGLLVWKVDERQPDNTDENHYKVALLQADGKRDLERARNRGDAGDAYPGSTGNASLTGSTNPNTRSYTGEDTEVAVTRISAPGAEMTATVAVRAEALVGETGTAGDGAGARRPLAATVR